MSFAEIGSTLNSTIRTSERKPLDDILLRESRVYVATDEPIIYRGGRRSVTDTFAWLDYFKFNIDIVGTLRAKIRCRDADSSDYVIFRIIDKQGNEIFVSPQFNESLGEYDGNYTWYTFDFSILNVGEHIFQFYSSDRDAYISEASLSARILCGKPIKAEMI